LKRVDAKLADRGWMDIRKYPGGPINPGSAGGLAAGTAH
jgi:hypothetical protein